MFDPHPTLREIIDAAEAQRAAQPAPIDPAAALTTKGHALVAGYRFIRALRELSPEDRAATLALFAADLRDVIADLAAPATA